MSHISLVIVEPNSNTNQTDPGLEGQKEEVNNLILFIESLLSSDIAKTDFIGLGGDKRINIRNFFSLVSSL